MLTNRSTFPFLAGVLFALVGALELAHDQANPFDGTLDYVIEGVFVAALAAGAAALWQLRDAGAQIPFSVAAAGHAVLLLPAGATFVRGSESLDPLFPLGVLAILLGILAAAVADARGRVVPRRAGVLLLAGWIVAFAANTTIGVGLAWLVIAALTGRVAIVRRAQPVAQQAKAAVARALSYSALLGSRSVRRSSATEA